MKPSSRSTADQVKEMGLHIGDVIVGRETHQNGEWNEARLTLLWCGEVAAVFRNERRTSQESEWKPFLKETASWDLRHRDWAVVHREWA